MLLEIVPLKCIDEDIVKINFNNRRDYSWIWENHIPLPHHFNVTEKKDKIVLKNENFYVQIACEKKAVPCYVTMHVCKMIDEKPHLQKVFEFKDCTSRFMLFILDEFLRTIVEDDKELMDLI